MQFFPAVALLNDKLNLFLLIYTVVFFILDKQNMYLSYNKRSKNRFLLMETFIMICQQFLQRKLTFFDWIRLNFNNLIFTWNWDVENRLIEFLDLIEHFSFTFSQLYSKHDNGQIDWSGQRCITISLSLSFNPEGIFVHMCARGCWCVTVFVASY